MTEEAFIQENGLSGSCSEVLEKPEGQIEVRNLARLGLVRLAATTSAGRSVILPEQVLAIYDLRPHLSRAGIALQSGVSETTIETVEIKARASLAWATDHLQGGNRRKEGLGNRGKQYYDRLEKLQAMTERMERIIAEPRVRNHLVKMPVSLELAQAYARDHTVGFFLAEEGFASPKPLVNQYNSSVRHLLGLSGTGEIRRKIKIGDLSRRILFSRWLNHRGADWRDALVSRAAVAVFTDPTADLTHNGQSTLSDMRIFLESMIRLEYRQLERDPIFRFADEFRELFPAGLETGGKSFEGISIPGSYGAYDVLYDSCPTAIKGFARLYIQKSDWQALLNYMDSGYIYALSTRKKVISAGGRFLENALSATGPGGHLGVKTLVYNRRRDLKRAAYWAQKLADKDKNSQAQQDLS
ncbi:MAG: hypothetical protein JW991_01660 [Candidatus Pacebacteria bacterium]|nr:hypothetical protein [Candidatus Paceibacterota bacterium]